MHQHGVRRRKRRLLIDLLSMRTSPTVRTMNPVNKADRKRWEVRLGPVQAVILIGGVLGCMAASWHLGAYSGQHVGFDKGRSASVSAVSYTHLTLPTTHDV